MYSLLDLFYTNLTPYTGFELWVTRTCLVLAFLCVGPTIMLISLDLFLWAFRTGEVPAKTLLKRSRSGLGLVTQAVTARTSGTSPKGVSSSGLKMTSAKRNDDKENKPVDAEHAVKVVPELKQTPSLGIKREETDPLGGVSNRNANEIKLGKIIS